MKNKKEIIEKIGYLIKNFNNEHDKEYRYGFQIHHNTLIQKLIPISIIETELEIDESAYFKSLIFLDYLVNTILAENKIIYNLTTLQKVIPQTNKRPLTLGIIVTETGLYAKEKNDLLSKENVIEIQKRYASKDSRLDTLKYSKKPDPYYLGIAEMIYDMVSEDNKENFVRVMGKNDLKALIFTDSISSYLKDLNSKNKILKSLKDNFFNASMVALEELQKEVSIEDLKKYIGAKND